MALAALCADDGAVVAAFEHAKRRVRFHDRPAVVTGIERDFGLLRIEHFDVEIFDPGRADGEDSIAIASLGVENMLALAAREIAFAVRLLPHAVRRTAHQTEPFDVELGAVSRLKIPITLEPIAAARRDTTAIRREGARLRRGARR